MTGTSACSKLDVVRQLEVVKSDRADADAAAEQCFDASNVRDEVTVIARP